MVATVEGEERWTRCWLIVAGLFLKRFNCFNLACVITQIFQEVMKKKTMIRNCIDLVKQTVFSTFFHSVSSELIAKKEFKAMCYVQKCNIQ